LICLSIVSHGQLALAAALLRTLSGLQPEAVSQIIYTRNIPEPDLPPLELPGVALEIVSNSQPKGFGANHNAAFERCRQPYFCVLNPDILLPMDPFPPLLEALGDRSVGLVAPLVTTPQNRIESTARSLYTPAELLRQKLRPRNQGESAHWVAGMFMLFRSDAFRSVSGFDPGYFLYIEDVDICTRLRVAGWQLRQVPQARVIHDAQKRSHRSPTYTRWHLAGMLRYWRSPAFWKYRRMLRSGRS
jgi:N-acetylglucosaminyl-diphospho-decaprenol L-rhamnosyltransferase